ncbi:ribonuclease kappa-like [Chrysoperla carnea]|uniref:ribonuclease kappa-like n=1 Tax=Chrysoperla carnea TaxID=189513 RepID=UPI001D075ED1|nr:ribonuclease kappa-like [Chrysoperla carnea]
MKICGPKLSLCGLLISIWGVIQLVLMGLFYYVKSVALIEDLGIEEKFENINDFYAEADKRYTQSAYNCWIAACLYIFTLLFSAHQFYVNSRCSLNV